MGAHVVVALWQARPDTAGELQEVLRAMVEPSRAEPGCHEFVVHRSVDDPTTFMLYERYDDVAAHRAHLASRHFTSIAAERGLPLLASRSRSTYELLVPAGGPAT